jgi:hypothetical protein
MLVATLGACSDDDGGTNHNNHNGNNNDNPVCGNGDIDPGEECDDGAANSDTAPDACRTDCRAAFCGDAVIDSGEVCDDENLDHQQCLDRPGYTHGTLACASDCTWDESECYQCGNGVVEPEEDCDGTDLAGENCGSLTGKPDGALACATDCTFDSSGCSNCGDGLVEGNEECDLGLSNSDEPNAICRLNCTHAGCGDGITDDNTEACDCGTDLQSLPTGCVTVNVDGVANACKTDCSAPTCGDALVDNVNPWGPAEACDEGASNCDDDPSCTCSTTCQLPGCGNGVLEPALGEDCDCGASAAVMPASCSYINCVDHAACECNTSCVVPGCGNNVVDFGEQCDAGTANCDDSQSCTCATNCTTPACGNGVTETYRGEECDDGSGNCNAVGCTCNLSCLTARCGNGVTEGDEECDAGVNNCDDSSLCTCATNCTWPACGNGILEAYRGESCDDGAANCDTAGCGCSTGCQLPWVMERSPQAGQADLYAVWTDGTDAVAVGYGGVVLRRSAGGSWSAETSQTSEHLRGIDASGSSLVAVGDNNTITSWDAGSWTNWGFSTSPALHLTGVTCYAGTYSCWMSGDPVSSAGGSVIRYDGLRYNLDANHAYYAIWHYWNGANLLMWAVGEGGAYAEYGGGAWTSSTPFTTATLRGIWGDAVLNRFAVGTLGTVYHSTGSWAAETTPTTADLYDVSGTAGIVYAVGASGTLLRRNAAGTWTEETAFTNETLFGVAATGTMILAVGQDGIILRRP